MIGTHKDALATAQAALKEHESLRGHDLVLLKLKVARDVTWALDEALYELRAVRNDMREADEEVTRLRALLDAQDETIIGLEAEVDLLRSAHDL